MILLHQNSELEFSVYFVNCDNPNKYTSFFQNILAKLQNDTLLKQSQFTRNFQQNSTNKNLKNLTPRFAAIQYRLFLEYHTI